MERGVCTGPEEGEKLSCYLIWNLILRSDLAGAISGINAFHSILGDIRIGGLRTLYPNNFSSA
jgi:hypothetical protein